MTDTTAAKIPAIRIHLRRAEGPTEEINQYGDRTVRGARAWEYAQSILQEWSRSAPEHGGCHKCDIVVTFKDGDEYAAQYDLKRTGSLSVGEHIQRSMSFYAGTRCPAHMTPQQYISYLATLPADTSAKCLAWLAKYDLGSI